MRPRDADRGEAYRLAQRALSDLKAAVYHLLTTAPAAGLTNAEIGRALGIHHGHIGHEGHIPRTLLASMESDGVVDQDPETKRWRLRAVSTPGSSGGESLGPVPAE